MAWGQIAAAAIGGLGALGAAKEGKVDPWKVAKANDWASTQALLREMQANQYGTQTPWGSVHWEVRGGNPYDRVRKFELSDRAKAHINRKQEANIAAFAELMNYIGGKASKGSLTPVTSFDPAPVPEREVPKKVPGRHPDDELTRRRFR